MKTIPKTKTDRVSVRNDEAKPRRAATKTIPKTDRVSVKDDEAKPRRAATKTIPKTDRVSVKDDEAKPRRTATKTIPKPKTDRASVRDDGANPRRAAKTIPRTDKAPAKKDTAKPKRADAPAAPRRGGPAKPVRAAKPVTKAKGFSLHDEAVKPRRVGTKLTRLLDLNIAQVNPSAPARTTKPRHDGNASIAQWLLYCRPGFELDCAQEALGQARAQRPVLAQQPEIIPDSAHAVVSINEQTLSYRDLIFARQLIRLQHTIEELPERDRLTPILTAINTIPGTFSAMWLEVPDTNDGKTLSAFTRRFGPLLETALREQGRLVDDVPGIKNPRLHIFFPDKSSAMIGTSDPYNSAASIMGIVRQSMPSEAPSRSTMKLAEAIEVFLDKSEQTRLLRSGMTAVDLGAAPGGWTWQMVRRGIRVTAVDNGPMKGVMDKHPLVEHLKQDGFKFTPRKSVDWLICDMVEKPAKVAELIGNWFASGWCKHAIFNLKLPMKQRVTTLDAALGGIRSRLDMDGISYKMIAKQLYHDREEITVFLSKTKNR